MAKLIESQFDTPYPSSVPNLEDYTKPLFAALEVQEFVNASNQKGGNGTFTCVGLIEWAAEQAGHNNGGGFIPEWMEVNPLLLNPTTMYWAATVENFFEDAGQFFGGLIDPADFLITDPLGRQFGYTAELGLVDEIPGMLYSGDGFLEQFLLLDPLAGEYELTLFGTDAQANAIFSSRESTTEYSQFLSGGEASTIMVEVAAVPEPSSLVLAVFAAIMGLFYRKKKVSRLAMLNN